MTRPRPRPSTNMNPDATSRVVWASIVESSARPTTMIAVPAIGNGLYLPVRLMILPEANRPEQRKADPQPYRAGDRERPVGEQPRRQDRLGGAALDGHEHDQQDHCGGAVRDDERRAPPLPGGPHRA